MLKVPTNKVSYSQFSCNNDTFYDYQCDIVKMKQKHFHNENIQAK